MPISNTNQLAEPSIAELSDHSLPDLSDEEIAEAKESLRRYFEIGWKIASRLQREGRLDEALTKAEVNPTVKPLMVDQS